MLHHGSQDSVMVCEGSERNLTPDECKDLECDPVFAAKFSDFVSQVNPHYGAQCGGDTPNSMVPSGTVCGPYKYPSNCFLSLFMVSLIADAVDHKAKL